MALVSMAEAARLAGRGRATIYRDIEKGKLSRSILADGKPGIDISELMRVYGKLKIDETAENVSSLQGETLRDTVILEEKIRSLESQLRHKDEMTAQLQARIDDKQFIIDELKTKVLLIGYLKPVSPVAEEKIRPTGFWSRLMGGTKQK